MKKILVIGSGPIIIGQAAEFDYAGTQACKSLREEGYSVVLINSNPATIMTDQETADAVYIEPLTVEFCERVIARERPEGLLPTLGGQTGLNLASQLADAGILERYGVKLLGTPLSAIRKAEDRELFRSLMREIKEPVPESWIVESDDDLRAVLDEVPYPCIVRPAYTLGGTGGGVAYSPDELWEIGRKGLKLSMRSQLMIERSLLGWKEVEYEVMRDSAGNCITVCNMENFDPMGVHTGDSIVVAPSQTLSDIEYHMMRAASLKIINALGIEGGCNVQMALNPDSFDYYIIEVNPRVSRSSALASKATGYPIARVAAKIAVGRTLDEIENMVTKTTKACFEPALDYCVVKIPRWPFDKFASGDRRLSSQMKATGEVMAIDRTFESAFMKAIRGLEVKQKDLRHPRIQALSDADLEVAVSKPTDERLWAVAEALRRGWSLSRVYDLSRVDTWFLEKLDSLVKIEQELVYHGLNRSSASRVDLSEFQIRDGLEHVATKTMPDDELFELCAANQPQENAYLSSCAKSELAVRNMGAREVAVAAGLDPCSFWVAYCLLNNRDESSVADCIKRAFVLGYPSPSVKSLMGITAEIESAVKSHAAVVKELLESAYADEYEYCLDHFDSVNDPIDDLRDLPQGAREHYDQNWPRLLRAHARLVQLGVAGQAEWLPEVIDLIESLKIQPVFKMVDTCAGEFESATPYYYGTFETEDDAKLAFSK